MIALAKCFQEKPLVALTFSSPLVRELEDVKTGEIQTIQMALLDYNKEF